MEAIFNSYARHLTAFTDHATVERVKHTYPSAFLAKPYQITNVRIAIELALNSLAVRVLPSSADVSNSPSGLLRLSLGQLFERLLFDRLIRIHVHIHLPYSLRPTV
jgi:hypothetical protein